MEALLLEEKLLMVNERKVRDDLRAADDAMLELNKQVRGIRCNEHKYRVNLCEVHIKLSISREKVMGHDEEVQRRREELEAQAERATAQHRHLQGPRSIGA